MRINISKCFSTLKKLTCKFNKGLAGRVVAREGVSQTYGFGQRLCRTGRYCKIKLGRKIAQKKREKDYRKLALEKTRQREDKMRLWDAEHHARLEKQEEEVRRAEQQIMYWFALMMMLAARPASVPALKPA